MLGMKDGAMEVEDNKLQPATFNDLKVVSFGFFAEQEHQAAIYRGPIISGILKQFLVDTNWTDLDYLIVDLPPGTGDIPLTLAQTIPITGILVVTTPQDVASNVAVKAIGMFDKLNVPILGVVENMSYFACPDCTKKHYIFGNGGAKKISEKHEIPFLGEIPLNSGIMEGSDLGKPVMMTNTESPSADAFRIAAKNVAAQCSIVAAKLQEEIIPNDSSEKESYIRKIYSEKVVITVGDATSELLLEMGLIPLLHIVDGQEKREKRSPPETESISTELTIKNNPGEISTESFNLLKTIFDQKPPIRLLVDGEEDLLVLPVCLFAPENSVVMYGQPNEGLVIAEITDEVREKVQKIVNQMK